MVQGLLSWTGLGLDHFGPPGPGLYGSPVLLQEHLSGCFCDCTVLLTGALEQGLLCS